MIRHLVAVLALAVFSCAAPSPALALVLLPPATGATIAVTPATIAAAFAAAVSGDVLVLGSGVYPAFKLSDRAFSPPLTVRATDAVRLHTVTLARVSGVNWIGGNFADNAGIGPGYGLLLSRVSKVNVSGALSTNNRMGFVVTGSDINLATLECVGSTADCVHITDSVRITVDRLFCHDGAVGLGEHPDCVQLIGYTVPLTDITIANSTATGTTQGFDMFGNLLPASRINYINLTVRSTYSRGISMTNSAAAPCLDCKLINASVDYIRGATRAIQLDPHAAGPFWTGTIVGATVGSTRPVIAN